MKHLFLSGIATTLITFGVGCTTTGSGSAQYSANATVTTPELIMIEPGVQVVADYHEPVFYTDNYYWKYDAGTWYRSDNHARGWVQFDAVPPRIRGIEQPTAYIRYRGEGGVHARGGDVRDHRDNQPPPVRQPPPPPQYNPPPMQPTPPPAQYNPPPPQPHSPPPMRPTPPPAVQQPQQPQQPAPPHHAPPPRDPNRKEIREEAKDARKDAKEERKDQRHDMKEERKDAKQDAKEERKDAKDHKKGH